MSTNDPLRSCRFCLLVADDMRTLTHDQLPHTDIPQLFESLTAIKLDCSPGYSELLCSGCEQRLRSAAQIRADFVRVAQQWQVILRNITVAGTSASSTSTAAATSSSAAASALKAERADDDDEDGGGGGTVGDETKFVECKLGDVKQEKDCDSDDYDAYYGQQGDDDQNASSSSSSSSEEAGEVSPPERPRRTVKRATKATKAPKVAKEKPPPKKRGRKPGRKSDFGRPLEGQPLTCHVCSSKLATKTSMLAHLRNVHFPLEPGGSTCHICGKTNLKSMVHHLREHLRADQYKCAHCPRAFSRRDMQRQHERTHTGERPFICEICAFSFTTNIGLRRHMQLRHNETNGRHVKQQVVRQRVLPPLLTASSESPMLKKLPTPHGIRLECPMCQRTYANRPSMHVHMKLTHGPEGLAQWKIFLATVCVICNERCADADALRVHRRIHQPFQCEICRRSFETRDMWERHVQKHPVKERRYKCSECDALYACSFTLRMHHRRAHTDYRPFPCPQCDLAFAENAEMNQHVRKKHNVPATRRTYVCELCPPGTPGYRTTEALRIHVENHTGQFRHQCKVCLRGQSSAVQLLEHMRGYHPAELLAMDAAVAAMHAGNNAGNSAGMNAGNSTGMNAGNSTGIIAGNSMGMNAGNSSGIIVGSSVGMNAGNNSGIDAGNNAGNIALNNPGDGGCVQPAI